MPNVILFAQRARGITKRSVVKNLKRCFVSLWLTPRSANATLSMTKQDHLFFGLQKKGTGNREQGTGNREQIRNFSSEFKAQSKKGCF
ncbi:hypothetical protein AA650_08960 [Anabaena sp. WA102]|nr:hypothetical protein AA650_08960 [Anabaena sp. WA102]